MSNEEKLAIFLTANVSVSLYEINANQMNISYYLRWWQDFILSLTVTCLHVFSTRAERSKTIEDVG